MANDITQNVAAIAGKRFMPKVSNAIFKVNGVPAFEAKANTDSQVNIQTTQDQIRAGQNNVVIGTITSEKTIDITFSTPEWKVEFLAANIGETIQVGRFAFEVTDKTYAVKDNKITLDAVPYDKVIYIDVNGSYVKIPATTTTVDLSAYGVTENCVSVIMKAEKFGKRVKLSADTVPLFGELTLDTPIYEGTKGKVGNSQYVFPAFALSGNWNHTSGADASYEISGTAVATNSTVCGEGQSYGYYQEFIDGEEDASYSMIVAAPSVVELAMGETETLKVYCTKGSLYAKSEITGATFATTDTSYFTVGADTDVITPVYEGHVTITVTYGSLTTTVHVEIVNS